MSAVGVRDVLMMSIIVSDITILNINGADYCCYISGISKSEPVKLLQKTDLNETNGTLQNIKIKKQKL